MNFDTLLEDYLYYGIFPILSFPNGMFGISYGFEGKYASNGTTPTGIDFTIGSASGFFTTVFVAGTWNTSRYNYNSIDGGWSIDDLL